MTNAITEDPLRVSTDEVAGPYLRVPLVQLDEVTSVLDRHGVWYWVDSISISVEGRPAVTYIHFGRNGQAARIQEILDQAGNGSPRGSQ